MCSFVNRYSWMRGSLMLRYCLHWNVRHYITSCVFFKSWGLLNNVYIGLWGRVLRHSRARRLERRPSGNGKLRLMTLGTQAPFSLVPAFLHVVNSQASRFLGNDLPVEQLFTWYKLYLSVFLQSGWWPAGTRTLPPSQRFLAEILNH